MMMIFSEMERDDLQYTQAHDADQGRLGAHVDLHVPEHRRREDGKEHVGDDIDD